MASLKGDESLRAASNLKFKETLFSLLNQKDLADFPFDSIPYFSYQVSQDKKIEIFTWNVIGPFNKHHYYGYVRYQKKRTIKVVELEDEMELNIKKDGSKEFDEGKWYGAMYYKIIDVKDKNGKYYVLLGLDLNNQVTNKKMIDVLTLSNLGKIHFGKDVFRLKNNKLQKRIVFEYSSEVVMSVKYDETRKQIIFDHLGVDDVHQTGFFQFYGPDFTYDALELEKDGKWRYISDVNIKGEVDVLFNPKDNPKEKEIYKSK